MMALYRYFQHVKSALPLPDGLLSTEVPASSIAAASKAVKAILPAPKVKIETGWQKHGPYDHFTTEEKARIGKMAAKHSVSATVHTGTLLCSGNK